MSITKADIADLDIADAAELISVESASDEFLSVAVVGVSSGEVEVSGADLNSPDTSPEAGDAVVISGSSAADGSYTFDSIVDGTHFTVVESVSDSTGGTASFRHYCGGKRVGIDTSSLTRWDLQTLQDCFASIDLEVALNIVPKKSNTTYTLTRAGGVATQEEWKYTTSGLKIKTIDYSRSGGALSTEVTKIYKSDGTTVIAQTTESFSRGGGGEVSGSTIVRDI